MPLPSALWRCAALALGLLAAGCNPTRLRTVPATPTTPGLSELMPDADQRFLSARFSPDGARIAFHAQVGGARDVVGVMGADGSMLTVLADSGSAQTSVAWSPDGKFLYFTSNKGIEQVPLTGGAATHVIDAVGATEVDVSADGATLLWVKEGDLLESLRRNAPNPVPTDEGKRGRYPRFDENGAVPGYVYVGKTAEGQRPLQRDLLGSGGLSGFVTMDLGAFPSVSVLGKNQYVITSAAGIERVTQAGVRTPISDEKAAMNVDASLDGSRVLYVLPSNGALYIAAGF